ncbi:MAG: tRNA pseudouridine(38-40) synthase TruA [Thermodesulfovibrionaceae bacterium]
MPQIKLLIQYDGTNYFGWQRQKEKLTIQAVLEESISKILKKTVKIRASGRTDTGVHALGQVATFRAEVKIPILKFKKAINCLLPPDIRVIDIEEVPDDFHPQYSVRRKSYLYYISLDEICSCFIQRYVWHYPKDLNLDAMISATEIFRGRKDFTAIAGSTDIKDKIRTVYELTVQRVDKICFLDMFFLGNYLKIRIEADGFLRYMVRNIVGALVEVGRGRLTIHNLEEAIRRGVKPSPLQTAPAKGLFLERVVY